MRFLFLLCLLSSSIASAQTRPLGLPRFADPPELNGADPALYENGLVYNTTLACTQRSNGAAWKCISTAEETAAAISSANAAQDAMMAATYMTLGSAQSVIDTMEGRINGNSSSISGLSSRVSSLEATTATQAALQAAVASLSSQMSTVQSQMGVRRACTDFTVPSGFGIPLAGISSTISVPMTGVPARTSCDVGAPSRMPLGARPDPIVLTSGTVSMAFVSNGGLLSNVISVPSGVYRLCCDM